MPIKMASSAREHPRVFKKFVGKSLTKQSMRDECDINKLMAQYERTGQINQLVGFSPEYADFSNVPDFKSALDQIHAAQENFDALPSRVRERFGNQPHNLVAFMEDPTNLTEATELGLVPAQIVERAARVAKAVIERAKPKEPEKPPIVGGE